MRLDSIQRGSQLYSACIAAHPCGKGVPYARANIGINDIDLLRRLIDQGSCIDCQKLLDSSKNSFGEILSIDLSNDHALLERPQTDVGSRASFALFIHYTFRRFLDCDLAAGIQSAKIYDNIQGNRQNFVRRFSRR